MGVSRQLLERLVYVDGLLACCLSLDVSIGDGRRVEAEKRRKWCYVLVLLVASVSRLALSLSGGDLRIVRIELDH